MIWHIIEYVLLFAECFLFIEFITRYNGIDWTMPGRQIAFAVTLGLSFIVVVITNARVENVQARLLIRTAVMFIYTMYFLEGSQMGKILSCLFFPFILLIAQVASGIFLSAISPKISLQQVWNEIGWQHALYQVLLLLIMFYSTRVFLRFRGSYRHPYRRIHILLSVGIPLMTLLFSGLLAELLNREAMSPWMLTMMGLVMMGILIINLVVYYLLSSIGNEGELVMENDMLKRYLQYEQRNMDEQKRTYEQIRSLRHEMKNYLSLLEQQIVTGRTEEALQFIEDYRGKIQQFSNMVQTDNETLNFIVNTHLSQAALLGIETKVRIEDAEIPLSDIDLHSLLGNIFNNAIESLEKLPDRRDLQLEIVPQGGYVSILCRNRIDRSVLEGNPTLMTTKDDVAQHGFGVKIIRAITEKYQGYVDFYEQDGYFCVRVLIPKEYEETIDE